VRLVQPVRPDPVEGGAAPERQRGGQPGPFGRRVQLGSGLVEQTAEAERVHVVRLGGQQVAAGASGDQQLACGSQRAAQPPDVRAHVRPRIAAGIRTPYRGGDAVRRDGPAGGQGQHGQQRAQPSGRQLDRPSGHRDAQRPEQLDGEHAPPPFAPQPVSPR
jgi:hypothetical protein